MDNREKPKQAPLSRAVSLLQGAARSIERLHYPPLGPDFGSLSGDHLASALIAHRFVKNLGSTVVPADIRRKQSIRAMLEYDQNGLTSFDYRAVPQPYRGLLLQAKAWLQTYFGKIPRRHGFRPPTGETVVTAMGTVDLISKLTDGQQWNVSLEASRDAAAVCYHNHALKRVVKARFRSMDPPAGLAQRWFHECPTGVRPGWYVFHLMFTYCCNIVNVSRLSTVPKNGEKDRTITMEPMWNMIAQLSYAADLRGVLRSRLGIDLESRAALHRTLIRHAEKATIDFANASNSNWTCVLKWLLPTAMYRKLMQLRTATCEYDGEYHHLNMLAPMGCGFTFEVMTIVLLALSRVLDPGATVFGDDVIIDRRVASSFVALTSHAGWKVNESKSFSEGNFRESCGGFHDLSTGLDLLSYDFHQPESMFDVCTSANKLYRLLTRATVDAGLRKILLSTYCSLIRLLPCETFRDATLVSEDLPAGVVLVPAGFTQRYRAPGVVERLVASYWHMPVEVNYKWILDPVVSRPKVETVTSAVYLACYIRRGSSYDGLARKQTLRYVTEIATRGIPLAMVPLMSFI